ncbi:MAG: guanylate kinase [bacterium]|nr:guanylate kinase [bacterium]
MNFPYQRRGLLLVISAPSGGGKSAVLERLRAAHPDLVYSVSVTTRAPRGSEREGIDYHYVTRQVFEEWIVAGRFYEWAEVHGNLYGTRADVIEAALDEGRDVVMDIDVQGGLAVKRRSPDAVLVFLLPPSMEVLEARLRRRATDDERALRVRLANAAREIDHWRRYDYVIVNKVLVEAVAAISTILAAERHRALRWLPASE